MPCCPTCNAPLSADRPLVDLNTNTFVYRDHVIELRPKTAEFLHTLVRNYPATTSLSDIQYAMWGMFEPEGSRYTMEVYASRIRKFLAPIGISLESVPGRGFKLVL